jgi:hypothetical protein
MAAEIYRMVHADSLYKAQRDLLEVLQNNENGIIINIVGRFINPFFLEKILKENFGNEYICERSKKHSNGYEDIIKNSCYTLNEDYFRNYNNLRYRLRKIKRNEKTKSKQSEELRGF